MKQKKEIVVMTAAEFKKKRMELNMTQTELSDALGYGSYITIYFKEKGLRAINKSDMIIINQLKPLKK